MDLCELKASLVCIASVSVQPRLQSDMLSNKQTKETIARLTKSNLGEKRFILNSQFLVTVQQSREGRLS